MFRFKLTEFNSDGDNTSNTKQGTMTNIKFREFKPKVKQTFRIKLSEFDSNGDHMSNTKQYAVTNMTNLMFVKKNAIKELSHFLYHIYGEMIHYMKVKNSEVIFLENNIMQYTRLKCITTYQKSLQIFNKSQAKTALKL